MPGRKLVLAAKNGHPEVVALPLDYGANVEAKDMHGRTSLVYAEENGHTKVEVLLKNAVISRHQNEKNAVILKAISAGFVLLPLVIYAVSCFHSRFQSRN